MDDGIFAIDFETYYDSTYSLKKMSPQQYVTDDRFDPYLVAIIGDKGFEWVGDPLDAPWEEISGDTLWLSHNTSFDMAVWARLVDLDAIADHTPREWHCTADLCAYLQAPRALDKAMWALFGTDVSKNVRAQMKATNYHTLPPSAKDEWHEYARYDSIYCLQIWAEFNEMWPQWEKDISNHSRLACWDGVRINKDMLEKGIKTSSTPPSTSSPPPLDPRSDSQR